jgi:uncharacterized membrane protein
MSLWKINHSGHWFIIVFVAVTQLQHCTAPDKLGKVVNVFILLNYIVMCVSHYRWGGIGRNGEEGLQALQLSFICYLCLCKIQVKTFIKLAKCKVKSMPFFVTVCNGMACLHLY